MENIWTYDHNQEIETEKVEMKTFKPVGRFFEDSQTLVKMFGVLTHPSIKESSYITPSNELASVDENTSQLKDQTDSKKEVIALNFYKYRIDKNTFRITFLCLPPAQQIQTLKFQNNGFTISQFNLLMSYLSDVNCPVLNLFLDWNPIYCDEGFVASDNMAQNKIYQCSEGDEENEPEMSPFARIVKDCKRLQVLFLRASGLCNRDVGQICNVLRPEFGAEQNKTLKVLDLSYNDFTGDAMKEFIGVFQENRTLEYLGLAKNKLTTEDVSPLLGNMGKVLFAPEQVEAHQEKIKQRNIIIEKNKKLKQQKKPEEPVPIVDNIEQCSSRDQDGNEIQQWFLLRAPQFKHLNLCMNKLDDDILSGVEDVLSRTSEDFGFTLTGNPLTVEEVSRVQGNITDSHKKAIQIMRNADPNSTVIEQEDIAIKRCAF